jgi:type III pantothenate kinase
MTLLLDIGNSRVKWAWLMDRHLERPGFALHRRRDFDEVLTDLPLDEPAPAAVLAASVAAPELTGALAHAVKRCWGLTMQLATTESAACGVRCGYTDPRQLGVDRWMAILGAHLHHQTPVCVVNAGTAVTIDLLRTDGEHLGGLIVPGLGLMQEVLQRDTGRIEAATRLVVQNGPAGAGPGRDTASGMRNGALLAISSLIRDCVRRANDPAFGATVVLTGGDAETLMPELDGLIVDHRPLLVLEGLALRHGGFGL